MRIFFATDVHGSEKTFIKFLNAANFYKAQILILGGDITGKMIVPLVKSPNGYTAQFRGVTREAKDEDQAQTLEKDIRMSGGYPYRTTPDEMTELHTNEAKVHSIFVRLMLEALDNWVKIAGERLRNTGVKMYWTGGNDDIPEIKDVIRKSDYVIDPEDKAVDIDGKHEMISLGWSTPTPWNTPRECSEEELAKKIEHMTSMVRNMKSCIFNFHVPPIDTIISECQALDKDLKPIMIGSEAQTTSGGSSSVSKSITEHQPLLGLHGHIHESKGAVKIGRTICINPGSEYAEGILRGAMINLEDEKVKSYLLTSG